MVDYLLVLTGGTIKSGVTRPLFVWGIGLGNTFLYTI